MCPFVHESITIPGDGPCEEVVIGHVSSHDAAASRTPGYAQVAAIRVRCSREVGSVCLRVVSLSLSIVRDGELTDESGRKDSGSRGRGFER